MPEEIGQVTAVDAETDPLVGTIVGERYEVLELIGKGGMGAVYKARQIYTKRTVALKILLPGAQMNVARSIRFRREAQAASALAHADIVTILDFGIANDFEAFLIMDFVPGTSLEDEIEKHGPLSMDRFVRIFTRACDAFAHAHKQGIIHRDIKDTNMMLFDSEDSTDNIKIVDFGLARILEDQDEPDLSLTETGATVGTPSYMSPEQCRGLKCDARSDIYSLGCVMYKALTGQPPFKAQARVDVMHKHMREFAPAMSVIVPHRGIPQSVERLVARCLVKEPDHRYQSMAELKHDLLNLPYGTTAVPLAPAPAETNVSPSPASPASAIASVASKSTTSHSPPVVSSGKASTTSSGSRDRVRSGSGVKAAASRKRALAYWIVSLLAVGGALLIGFSVINRSMNEHAKITNRSPATVDQPGEVISPQPAGEPTYAEPSANSREVPEKFETAKQKAGDSSAKEEPSAAIKQNRPPQGNAMRDETSAQGKGEFQAKAIHSDSGRLAPGAEAAPPERSSEERSGSLFDQEWPPWSTHSKSKETRLERAEKSEPAPHTSTTTTEEPSTSPPVKTGTFPDPSQLPYPPPPGAPWPPPPGAPFPPPPGGPFGYPGAGHPPPYPQ